MVSFQSVFNWPLYQSRGSVSINFGRKDLLFGQFLKKIIAASSKVKVTCQTLLYLCSRSTTTMNGNHSSGKFFKNLDISPMQGKKFNRYFLPKSNIDWAVVCLGRKANIRVPLMCG